MIKIRLSLSITLLLVCFSIIIAQNTPTSLYDALKWRMIGPHRGGRTVGAVGVPQQPNVFYIGVNNGGVWKTTDFGRTWNPIFDDQPTGSVGDVAVAPSNPNVLYVASGEGIQRPDLSVGDGIYKTTDGGKTWTNTGLRDGQQIGGLSIDPTDENRVFAAVLGHPYGANTERGVFRTLNGGKTWERVFYIDENTGAVQVTIDPKNPQVIYADMWAGRQGPWENGAWNGTESGLIKSTDGGNTWKRLTNGLPTTAQGLSRIGFCIAPSNTNRLYATVDAPPQYGGVYRSDDAGENWVKLTGDGRFWGRGTDFAEIKTDPKNADIVYDINVVTWKSTDGGKSWNAFRGAPGGDDYHRIWINPDNTDIILLASDQGAIITVNGGQTFSSWYNQPTAQFYHVSTDNSFPYNVLGGQQESGSVSIASRGNDGQISYRDWHPVGVEEYGYVAADPLDPNIIYGGKITKTDKRTGQVQNIAPEAVRSGKYRFVRTAPILFSPIDNKTLYFAGNVLFKTQNGGHSWDIISPDLTRDKYDDTPLSIGIYKTEDMKKMPRRGVIYTVAPSYKDINTIWAGTDDGFIQITKDGGKNWQNVTPPDMTPWSKISLMDASHFDINTAYAAVNRIRLDDMKPHIYKTKDGGKTWKEITKGLPNDPINAVREDPNRRGLLFAGSERAVYVSFDEGENWQSLRLNMPATSIRDLVIKEDDIVVGTHGRSFWILDDITPLRQIASFPRNDNSPITTAETTLFAPQNATRVRWSMYTDTPVPQEEPAGENPPDGAIINYFIKEKAKEEVILEIFNAAGQSIRRFSSHDTPYKIPDVNIPLYWIRPQQILSAEAGSHRFMWDLHYKPLEVSPQYPISAIYKNTEPEPTSPWVLPATYTVKLTVNGKTYTQSLTVKMDPRVKTSAVDLKTQHDLSLQCYEGRQQAMVALDEIGTLKKQIKDFSATSKSTAVVDKLKLVDTKISVLENAPRGSNEPNFTRLEAALSSIFGILHETDMPPTSQTISATNDTISKLKILLKTWNDLKTLELKGLLKN
jgi:photosystem II stability/assembly factor-like uncharacterized protein